MDEKLQPATTGLEGNQDVVAVAAKPATSEVPMWEQEKVGGKCCGCCCDYRRAVIIISIIAIVLGILGLISGTGTNTNQVEDDDLVQEIEDIAEDYQTGAHIIAILGFINAIIALAGAVTFNKYLVGFTIVYSLASYVASAIAGMSQLNEVLDYIDEKDLIKMGLNTTAFDDDKFNDVDWDEETEDGVTDFIRVSSIIGYIIGAIITLFFLYPSCCLAKEIHAGIMTKETYAREQHSCCCAPSPGPLN